jgi:hypothetical protein
MQNWSLNSSGIPPGWAGCYSRRDVSPGGALGLQGARCGAEESGAEAGGAASETGREGSEARREVGWAET